ncbi:MAG: hypothetical protein ABIM44_05115 [candidate division WOR-3 bacterium]
MVKSAIVTVVALGVLAILGWGLWAWSYTIYGVERGLLETEVQILETQLTLLNKSYSLLETERMLLKAKITILEMQIKLLNESYCILESKYNEIIEDLINGQATAASATWVSEDERLLVKSELAHQYLSEETWYYAIRVSVTNISNEQLNAVWIFLFLYENGSLIEGWSPVTYSKRLENLNVGETRSQNFTYIPRNITTYRVFAVASASK